MPNLFGSQISVQDYSMQYLFQLFGSMNGVLSGGGASGAAGNVYISLLSTMFYAFNTVVLSVAVLIVVYVTVISVMSTAHEGEFMKKYHGMWTPIRMVVGIAALVPIGTGYSAVQLVLMWVVVQGIGAADLLLTTTVNYITNVGSPAAQICLPSTSVQTQMNQLFAGITCDVTSRMGTKNPAPGNVGAYYCQSNKCTGTQNPFVVNDAGTYNMGVQPALCGTMSYCSPTDTNTTDPSGAPCTNRPISSKDTSNDPNYGPDSLACAVCTAQGAVLSNIVQTFSGIAQTVSNVDYTYRDFYYNSWQGTTIPGHDWGWIQKYCAATPGLSAKGACCVASNSPNAPPSSCSSTFINPDSAYSATSPPGNVVTSMYWPYGMRSIGAPNDNFINDAVTLYMGAMAQATTTWVAGNHSSASTAPPAQNSLTAVQQRGWLYAGASYFLLAQGTGSTMSASMPYLQTNIMAPTNFNYRNNYYAATALTDMFNPTSSASSNPALPQQLAPLSCPFPALICPLMGPINSLLQDVQTSISVTTQSLQGGGSSSGSSGGAAGCVASGSGGSGGSGGGGANAKIDNPLLAIASTGQTMIRSAAAAYGVLTILNFGLGIVSGISLWFPLGEGFFNPMFLGYLVIITMVLPLLMMIVGIVFSLGVILAVYIPMIPLVIFTSGVIGWFLLVIEAMVAGPIVALGILAPNAQGHELLGKAEHGMMIIFDVFLRPSLMIFGLIAAMLLANVVVQMVIQGFWYIFASSINKWMGPTIFILYLFAYVGLLTVSLNKCFSLIYLLPQRVMQWIGQHGAQGTEGQDLAEVKGKIGEGGQAIEQKDKGVQQGAKELGGKHGASVEARRKQQFKGSAEGENKK